MIPRELYLYHHGDKIVSGKSDKKDSRRLIRSRRADNETTNENPNNTWGGEEQLTTSDGFTSSGAPATGSKPVMRSKWSKGGRSAELQRAEDDDVIKQNMISDISQHCKALRDNPSTWLVDYKDSTQR